MSGIANQKIPTIGRTDPRRIEELEKDLLGVSFFESEDGNKTILFSNHLHIIQKIYNLLCADKIGQDLLAEYNSQPSNALRILSVLKFHGLLGEKISVIQSDSVFGNYIEFTS